MKNTNTERYDFDGDFRIQCIQSDFVIYKVDYKLEKIDFPICEEGLVRTKQKGTITLINLKLL